MSAILDFSKLLFSAKLQQIVLKLPVVKNMCLHQDSDRNIIKNRVEKRNQNNFDKKLFSCSNFNLHKTFCINYK